MNTVRSLGPAAALTAVSAEREEARRWAETMQAQKFEWENREAEARIDRDRLHKAITEALDHDPLHGRSEELRCGGMSPCIRGILRAALDKEGNDDERR